MQHVAARGNERNISWVQKRFKQMRQRNRAANEGYTREWGDTKGTRSLAIEVVLPEIDSWLRCVSIVRVSLTVSLYIHRLVAIGSTMVLQPPNTHPLQRRVVNHGQRHPKSLTVMSWRVERRVKD